MFQQKHERKACATFAKRSYFHKTTYHLTCTTPFVVPHRLRQGELALWPELVVEQAKCFSYLPTARKRLDVAARLGVVGLEDWKPKDEQHPQPSKSVT
jgi:hypothetical protein